jgi:hypothetical protein
MAMTKKDKIEMVQAIDLVGMALCANAKGMTMPPEINEAMIGVVGTIRAQLEQEFGLTIDPMAALVNPDAVTDATGKHNLTPSEAADEIMKDLFEN